MSDVRDPLATDHLVDDLKARSVRGGALTVAAQVLKYGVDIAAIAVLARLLTPGDFGLVAMVAAVVGFLATFKDAGLSAATIQRENVVSYPRCWNRCPQAREEGGVVEGLLE